MTQLLGQDKQSNYAGDFVLQNQTLATKQGFGHVSEIWYKKTQSYDDGFAQMAADRSLTEDIVAPLFDFKPAINGDGQCVMQYKDGRQFIPTAHCVKQIGTRFGTGTWYAENLAANKFAGDGAALQHAFAHGQKKFAAELAENIKAGGRKCTSFLYRTRQDGTIRAMLTEDYAIVNNEWYLNVIKKIIPGGRLSHWRGDSDTIWGNILIPDTIRADVDSDYGGMVSIGNCEIGTRAIYQWPSVFRAICMNGCIWNHKEGDRFKVVHRGAIDLPLLEKKIRENIETQISLLPDGIQRLLGLRAYKDDITVKPLVAQVAQDVKLSKGQASAILAGYVEENKVSPDTRGTLFQLVNSITRAGQKLDNQSWYTFDQIGGRLMNYSLSDWSNLVGRAKQLKAKQVNDSFAIAV